MAEALPNTFAGEALDRAGPRRSDERWLAAAVADPASRAIFAGPEGVLVVEHDGRVAPAEVPVAALQLDEQPLLLGVDARGAVFAVELDQGGASLVPGASVRGLREVAPSLSQADGGLLAHASALLNWHRRHGFCANCGARTVVGEAGYVRNCPVCGAQHHPRTDPVVIMLVHDGDRVLLGRQRPWPAGRYSALAGFVEPGESLEEAVAREVGEEAGIAVDEIHYRSSQPWPFPASLMLGFVARYAGGEPSTHDRELEDVRWVSRAELEDAAGGRGDMLLPPRDAIARRLMEEWLALSPRGAADRG